ncbi:MAG: carboxylate--amine ligase, partial [Acidimicrobiales bacterium]
VARILAARGVPVIGVAGDRRHWAARTRVVRHVIETDHNSAGLVDELVTRAHEFPDGAVLIPCTDVSVLAVARSADVLRPTYRFSLPGAATVERLLDKASFASAAADAGGQVARTYEIRGPDDAAAVVEAGALPCVVKPARKDARWLEGAPDKAFKVDTAEELVHTVSRALGWSDHLIVQEWVPGTDEDLVTCNCYIGPDGKVEGVVVSTKLRQWPPRTGTASAAVTVDDPEVAGLTVDLLTSVGFVGFGYVEFKRHATTGVPMAIEANVGRPTGRSAMAEAAGTELHHAYYADLAGLSRPALEAPRAGVTWLHLRRDIQAAAWGRRRRELTLGSWLRSLRAPRRYAVASWSDPVPFLLDWWAVVAKRLPRLRGGGGRPTAPGGGASERAAGQ